MWISFGNAGALAADAVAAIDIPNIAFRIADAAAAATVGNFRFNNSMWKCSIK